MIYLNVILEQTRDLGGSSGLGVLIDELLTADRYLIMGLIKSGGNLLLSLNDGATKTLVGTYKLDGVSLEELISADN